MLTTCIYEFCSFNESQVIEGEHCFPVRKEATGSEVVADGFEVLSHYSALAVDWKSWEVFFRPSDVALVRNVTQNR